MNPWRRVDEFIERAESVSALHSHRLHLYAAWRWRSLGRPLDPELVQLERGAAVQRLSQPAVVKLVRDAYDGPMILLKGADVAARYPRPELRPSQDLDLLVPDASAVQAALIGHGFTVCGRTDESHHHLPTLEWPGLLTRVEIHSVPNWPTWLTPPRVEELFDVASAESVLGHGILTLPQPHHALLLTAHLWREVPMARLGQLLDTLLMADGVAPHEIEALARRWRIERLWGTTNSTARCVLLADATKPRGARLWTRRLEALREATVIEAKLSELMAPFWGLGPAGAVRASTGLIAADLRPEEGEGWRAKVRRSATALHQSFRPRVERDRRLEAERLQRPRDD